jgi:hypothetical protein
MAAWLGASATTQPLALRFAHDRPMPPKETVFRGVRFLRQSATAAARRILNISSRLIRFILPGSGLRC